MPVLFCFSQSAFPKEKAQEAEAPQGYYTSATPL